MTFWKKQRIVNRPVTAKRLVGKEDENLKNRGFLGQQNYTALYYNIYNNINIILYIIEYIIYNINYIKYKLYII